MVSVEPRSLLDYAVVAVVPAVFVLAGSAAYSILVGRRRVPWEVGCAAASGAAEAASAAVATAYLYLHGALSVFVPRDDAQYLAVTLAVVLLAPLVSYALSRAEARCGVERPAEKVVVKCLEEEPLLAAVLLLVVAPLCEEILFRGLLQLVLASYLGPWPALAVASLAFSASHIKALGPRGAALTLLLSVLLGAPVAVLESLAPSIAAHALANLVGLREIAKRAGQRAAPSTE